MVPRAVTTALLCVVGTACMSAQPEAGEPRAAAVLAVPADCRPVLPGAPLQSQLDAAADGQQFCLAPGLYLGPITVDRGIGLWGVVDSVIKSNGKGTTVLLLGNSSLHGLTVDGSGGRFDVVDAAVKVHGDGVVVEGLNVRNSAFGILAERSKHVAIRDNTVFGIGGAALGLRGDGIRLWETFDSTVERNIVRHSRDCVVWYSSRNTVEHNDVRNGRYGIHFMYSHDNRISNNALVENEVGLFIMYSRNLAIDGNRMHHSRGASGIGLGVKESGNLRVTNNSLVNNTQSLFLDNSPLTEGDSNLFADNDIRLSDIGVDFLSSHHDNTFTHNAFVDNTVQVRVEGGGDALGVRWVENEWDDYAGYDLDRDGLGDIPYELKDLADTLTAKHPDLTFLRGTPALALIAVAGEVVPLLAPKPILRDERPRFRVREGP